MSLQHELRVAGSGIPELNATVLGARENPRSVGGEGNGEDEVLVTLEGLDAAAPLGSVAGVLATRGHEFPHLDGLVQRTGDQILAVGRERNRVDGILVPVRTLEALDQVARGGIPDADTLVERSGCDVLGVGGDGDRGDPVLDAKSEDVLTSLDIPEADRAVATTRSNRAPVTSKVQRIDVLLVTGKSVADRPRRDIPNLNMLASFRRSEGATYSNQLVLGSSSKVPPVRTEAHAADVQVAHRIDRLVLENGNLESGLDIENLGRTVASGRDKFSVVTEPDTADDTLVLQGVEKVDIEHARDLGVEDGEPISFDLFLMCWETLQIQLRQGISDSKLRTVLVGRRVADLGRCRRPRIGVWHGLVQLRCRWSPGAAVERPPLAWTRGGRILRGLGVAIRSPNSRISTLERRLLWWGWGGRRRTLNAWWSGGLGHLVLRRTVLL